METGGENGMSIENSIHHAVPGLESIEKTILLKQRGIVLLFVKKQYQDEISNYLMRTIIL